MRKAFSFYVLLSFALLETLLLQSAVLVNGLAHPITAPPALATTAYGGSFGSNENDPQARNTWVSACDVSSYFLCSTGYCYVDSLGGIGCCKSGSFCAPKMKCQDEGIMESCGEANQCTSCADPKYPACAYLMNIAIPLSSFTRITNQKRFISRYDPDVTLRSGVSIYRKDEPVSSMSGMVYTGTYAASTIGITVTVTERPPTKTPTANEPMPSADTGKVSSGNATGKNVGIAFGVLGICSIAVLGAWWAYRRHLKQHENVQNSLWNTPGAGPHHEANPIELESTKTQRTELEASPSRSGLNSAPASIELDATPKPVELDISSKKADDTLLDGSAPISPLTDDAGRKSPVSPVPNITHNYDGRYGPRGFLNPEYALRDGIWDEKDEQARQAYIDHMV